MDGGHRAHVEEMPAAPIHHLVQEGMRDDEGAREVGFDLRTKRLNRHGAQAAGLEAARVVDDDIGNAPSLKDRGGHLADLALVGHVAEEELRIRAALAADPSRLLEDRKSVVYAERDHSAVG